MLNVCSDDVPGSMVVMHRGTGLADGHQVAVREARRRDSERFA